MDRVYAAYVVVRYRDGWAVTVNSDRLGIFKDVADARLAAKTFVEIDKREGRHSLYVDLSVVEGSA